MESTVNTGILAIGVERYSPYQMKESSTICRYEDTKARARKQVRPDACTGDMLEAIRASDGVAEIHEVASWEV